MKKIISAIIAVALTIVLFSVTAFAADGDDKDYPGIKTIDEWNENGYPSDIGFAFYTITSRGYDPTDPDSSPEFEEHVDYYIYFVKGTPEELVEEVKEMFIDGNSVTVRTSSISHIELEEIATEVREALGENVFYVNCSAKENDVVIAMFFPPENHGIVKDYVMAAFPEYDGLFEFHQVDDISDITNEVGYETVTFGPDIAEKPNDMLLFFAVTLALAAVAAISVTFIRTRSKKLALSNGETVGESAAPTKKEVEREVAESSVSPSDSVMDEIIKKM